MVSIFNSLIINFVPLYLTRSFFQYPVQPKLLKFHLDNGTNPSTTSRSAKITRNKGKGRVKKSATKNFQRYIYVCNLHNVERKRKKVIGLFL